MEFNQAVSVADYFADREGLTGASRESFLRLLRDDFGITPQTPRRPALAVGTGAGGIALFGIWFEMQHDRHLSFILLWIGVAALGVALAFVLTGAFKHIEPANREIEWRSYCLLIRPILIAERPGLLDRNLRDDHGIDERLETGFGRAMMAMLRGRRIDLWRGAAVGWGIGTAALVILRVKFGLGNWPFAAPIIGIALVPFGWCSFKLAAFSCALRSARAKG